MPSRLFIIVREARKLPAIDRKRKTTDCFIDISWGDEHYHTKVITNNLNPKWEGDDKASWTIDVIEETRLQDEPLIFKVMDHDTYSSGSLIGTVVVDLNTMLMRSDVSNSLDVLFDGWMPIYDTIDGIRGELNIAISMELKGDKNQMEEGSTGIFIYGGSEFDKNQFQVLSILGFVEALVAVDDPEFEFEERFRSSQKSNEKRQQLLYHLSMKLRRQVGKQAQKRGGNAVFGYQQFFDVEGDSGIVCRAYGTACVIKKKDHVELVPVNSRDAPSPLTSLESSLENSGERVVDSLQSKHKHQEICEIHTRDIVYVSNRSMKKGVDNTRLYGLFNTVYNDRSNNNNPSLNAQSIELLSIRKLPDCFHYTIGGVVASRAVKFLGKLHSKLLDIETRDSWWEGLRDEVRANTLRIGADLVLAYRETCSIHGDICVLSATGTAIKLDERNKGKKKRTIRCSCEAIHVNPAKRHTLFRDMQLFKCRRCNNAYVPSVVLSTLEIPANLETVGAPLFIQSCVTETKKDMDTREDGANLISKRLPFIELRLYNQLLVKLHSLCCNAIFGLSVEMEIGGSLLVATITGTAVHVPGLPEPGIISIKSPFQSRMNEPLQNYATITDILKQLRHNRIEEMKEEMEIKTKEWEENRKQQVKRINKQQQKKRLRQQRKKLLKSQSFNIHSHMNTVIEDVEGETFDEREAVMRHYSSHDSAEDSSKSRQSSIEISSSSSSSSSSDSESSSSSSSTTTTDSEEEKCEKREKREKHIDTITPTLCEVHPDNGIIEPEDNLETMKSNYVPWLPQNNTLFHSLYTYNNNKNLKDVRPLVLLKRVHLQPHSYAMNQLLRSMCSRFCYKIHRIPQCSVVGLDVQIRLPGEDVVEVCLTAMIASQQPEKKESEAIIKTTECQSDSPTPKFVFEVMNDNDIDIGIGNREDSRNTVDAIIEKREIIPDVNSLPIIETGKKKLFPPSDVFLTPLMSISGYHVKKYCGMVVLHFISEGLFDDEKDTMDTYNHQFLLEVLAVTKAHVRCIGGNALLSFHMLPQETAEEDVQKAYNMITITGDAVLMEEDFC